MGKTRRNNQSSSKKSRKRGKNSMKSNKGTMANLEVLVAAASTSTSSGRNEKRMRKMNAASMALIQSEHDEFRAEQASLRERNESAIRRRRNSKKQSHGSKSSFRPNEATFNPSTDTILSHGLNSRVHINNNQDSNSLRAGGGDSMEASLSTTGVPLNPLQTLATKYRSEEQQEERKELNRSRNNAFSLLADDSEEDEASSNLNMEKGQVSGSRDGSSSFSFVPATFVFKPPSCSSSMPLNNKHLSSPPVNLIGATYDPDL